MNRRNLRKLVKAGVPVDLQPHLLKKMKLTLTRPVVSSAPAVKRMNVQKPSLIASAPSMPQKTRVLFGRALFDKARQKLAGQPLLTIGKVGEYSFSKGIGSEVYLQLPDYVRQEAKQKLDTKPVGSKCIAGGKIFVKTQKGVLHQWEAQDQGI